MQKKWECSASGQINRRNTSGKTTENHSITTFVAPRCAFAALFCAVTLLAGCGTAGSVRTASATAPSQTTAPTVVQSALPATTASAESAPEQGGPVQTRYFCLADSQQQAEQIAEAYGITLESFESGVAVFVTDKTGDELERLAQQNSLPTLEQDQVVSAQEAAPQA